jgi:hypothetical protein
MLNRVPATGIVGSMLWVAAASACPAFTGEPAAIDALKLTLAEFSITQEDTKRTITTLGSISNGSSGCFESVVVEVKFFDAKRILVDSITQPLTNLVFPPSQDVAFRIRDSAAKPIDDYVTQSARVVSANPRIARGPTSQSTQPKFVDRVLSFGPMLLLLGLIGLGTILLQQLFGKNSNRSGALFARQNEVLQAQNAKLDRIIQALEQRDDSRNIR